MASYNLFKRYRVKKYMYAKISRERNIMYMLVTNSSDFIRDKQTEINKASPTIPSELKQK